MISVVVGLDTANPTFVMRHFAGWGWFDDKECIGSHLAQCRLFDGYYWSAAMVSNRRKDDCPSKILFLVGLPCPCLLALVVEMVFLLWQWPFCFYLFLEESFCCWLVDMLDVFPLEWNEWTLALLDWRFEWVLVIWIGVSPLLKLWTCRQGVADARGYWWQLKLWDEVQVHLPTNFGCLCILLIQMLSWTCVVEFKKNPSDASWWDSEALLGRGSQSNWMLKLACLMRLITDARLIEAWLELLMLPNVVLGWSMHDLMMLVR